jgi:GDP/UDP-N,N'-diacetylbacillosamine 2-epimerase (hydrolysing)
MPLEICVVTGTRAEYGLLRPLLRQLKHDSNFTLRLIVTGMHLSPAFGMTLEEIESDGFEKVEKIEILSDSDEPSAIAESVGKAISCLSKSFTSLRPDIVLLLGDRFEIFASATAALLCNVPVAHIHGGETTVGLMDEAFRHSITKMSHLHFVATNEYRSRVIQLGEHPSRVFLVGALGVENAMQTELLGRESLEQQLDIEFSERNVLITFHPVTLEHETYEIQMLELLKALSKLESTTLIFTHPNADTGGRTIIRLIEEFVAKHDHSYVFPSLGQSNYFSLIKMVDLVIGNSSSGLIEVPSFKKPTINIGDRQLGRVRGESVIDCAPRESDILNALQIAYSEEFGRTLVNNANPYQIDGTKDKIVNVLKSVNLHEIQKKHFYDLGTTCE